MKRRLYKGILALLALSWALFAVNLGLNSRKKYHWDPGIEIDCKNLKQKVPQRLSEHYFTSFDEIVFEWGEEGEVANYGKTAVIRGDGTIEYSFRGRQSLRADEISEAVNLRGRLSSAQITLLLKAINETNYVEIEQRRFSSCADCNYARTSVTIRASTA